MASSRIPRSRCRSDSEPAGRAVTVFAGNADQASGGWHGDVEVRPGGVEHGDVEVAVAKPLGQERATAVHILPLSDDDAVPVIRHGVGHIPAKAVPGLGSEPTIVARVLAQFGPLSAVAQRTVAGVDGQRQRLRAAADMAVLQGHRTIDEDLVGPEVVAQPRRLKPVRHDHGRRSPLRRRRCGPRHKGGEGYGDNGVAQHGHLGMATMGDRQ